LPACEAVFEESSEASEFADQAAESLNHVEEGDFPSPDTLPQHEDEWWLADIRPLATWFEDEGQMVRPMLAMVVDPGTGALLMQDVLVDSHADEEALWRVLLAAMGGPQVGDPRRPGEIGFRTAALVEQFGPRLAEFDVAALVVDDLGPIDFVANELGKRFGGGEEYSAMVDVPGMTNEHMRAFYEAAAEFRRRAPWRGVPMDAVLRVDRIEPAGPAWHGVVMGQSGMTYGVALYESLDDLLRLMSGAIEANEDAIKIPALSMTFGEAFDITPRDLDAQQRERWPVEGTEGYPNAVRLDLGGSMRPPLVWELELLTACLAGLPGFAFRPGATTSVTTNGGNGDIVVKLTWLDDVPRRH
jgi:hypothetical protein